MIRTLAIFAKPPLIGLSKTRLAATLGASEARRIARWTMGRTLREAGDPRWSTILYAAPDSCLSRDFGGLWPRNIDRRSQGAGDLGNRLQRALDEASIGSILFVGADAPDVSSALIWQAFQALKRHDAVFGPASDGGFWLFGINKASRSPSLFGDVRWSGPHAMADVRRNLGPAARVAELPVLIDIDDADDWLAWRKGWLKENSG
ncbi:MAG: TIGR04282 family arsenosugar biosynthesis glycosyltransferase [Pseudomonadota bacterium]